MKEVYIVVDEEGNLIIASNKMNSDEFKKYLISIKRSMGDFSSYIDVINSGTFARSFFRQFI